MLPIAVSNIDTGAPSQSLSVFDIRRFLTTRSRFLRDFMDCKSQPCLATLKRPRRRWSGNRRGASLISRLPESRFAGWGLSAGLVGGAGIYIPAPPPTHPSRPRPRMVINGHWERSSLAGFCTHWQRIWSKWLTPLRTRTCTTPSPTPMVTRRSFLTSNVGISLAFWKINPSRVNSSLRALFPWACRDYSMVGAAWGKRPSRCKMHAITRLIRFFR